MRPSLWSGRRPRHPPLTWSTTTPLPAPIPRLMMQTAPELVKADKAHLQSLRRTHTPPRFAKLPRTSLRQSQLLRAIGDVHSNRHSKEPGGWRRNSGAKNRYFPPLHTTGKMLQCRGLLVITDGVICLERTGGHEARGRTSSTSLGGCDALVSLRRLHANTC